MFTDIMWEVFVETGFSPRVIRESSGSTNFHIGFTFYESGVYIHSYTVYESNLRLTRQFGMK